MSSSIVIKYNLDTKVMQSAVVHEDKKEIYESNPFHVDPSEAPEVAAKMMRQAQADVADQVKAIEEVKEEEGPKLKLVGDEPDDPDE